MNRLATACAILFAALTVAAFLDHAAHGVVPPPEVGPVPAHGPDPSQRPEADGALHVAAGAGFAAPTRAPERSRIDLGALRARLDEEVVEPLRKHRLRLGMFSRRMLPRKRYLDLEFEETARPPRPDGRRFVMFRVVERRIDPRRPPAPPVLVPPAGKQTSLAEDQAGAPARRRDPPVAVLACGRVEAGGGTIEMLPGAHEPADETAYLPVAAALARMGAGKR